MIDRFVRNETAQALRHFASGQITNDDMEERIYSSSDPAIPAIYSYAWLLFDDLKQHKAKGKHALDKINKQTIARCVLFLRSEETYTYPPIGIYEDKNFLIFLLNVFSFGIFRRFQSKYKNFKNHGDTSVWPFENSKQLKRIALELSHKNKALL